MAPSLNTEGEAETRPQMEEKNKMVFAVDETPTPSRYIRHQYGCEDLFEEVCSGLNPFDEQFRRASQARSQPQINLESSTPHIMALSPRLSNVDTNSSCFHSNPHSQSSRNAGHGSKIRMHRSSPGVCDDDSLDTPRIIPPAPADSDHTISSTSKDDSCHQRYLQDRHYDYDENLSLGHGSERDKDCGCSHNDCSTLHHHREHSNHHCVSSSQFGLSQKSLPFRSISELSARMSNSDITTVTDDEAEEVSGKKRSCHEDEEDDEICVDDNGADVVEFDKRATKRRRTESLEVLSDGPILVSEENVCDVTDGQHKCHDSSGQVKYCNDDLQVVSDASMTESDEGYSSVRYPPSSHQEFAPSLMGSCETNFSPQNARTNRRCSGGRAGFSGRQKLSINVTSAAEAGMSSSSVISTPTPVITAGPSLTQCLRDAYPCSDERIVEDSFVSNSSHPCRTQPTTDHRLSNLSSHPSTEFTQPVSQEPLASYPCSVLTTSSVSDSLHSNGSLDKNSNGQRGKKRIVAPGEDDDEEKRMKFLERNRAAAVRCREKKKEWVKKLASKSTELATVNTRLQAEVASLRADVATLKGLLLQHKTCPVTLAALAGAYTDAAPAAPEGAPMPHNGVLTADSEDQQKPRSRSLSLPSLHQKPQQLQPPSALVANNVPQVLSVVAAGLPASTEGKADLTSATSHIPETSQAVPADLRTTNCLTRQSVLTLPIPMTSSIPINGSVVSAPSLSSTTKFIPVPAVHTSLVPGVINQQPPTFLSIHQPGPMTQAHAVVTFPNFSQAPLYCSSLPTFMTVPTTITNAVPIVSPYHHIQSSAEPAQPQPLAIAPAPLKMTPRLSSSRPAAANKEHFTLTSLAASLQFVQSSLTSSSRILSLPGSTSELNERATVTGVPGFTSSNLSVGNGPALVLDSSQPRLLLPSLSGQGSYIHGPVLSAQHIQHTTLTQHLALPLNCSDEAPTTAAILEDIAEIEESSSKIQSVGPASQEAPNEGTETVPYSIQSGDDAREKFHGSNVLVSTAHAAGTSETNVPLAGRPHNFLSIPTIVVSDESCGKVDDHNMDVSRCMPESGPTGTGPYHAIASSVQPSNVLGSTTSNTTTLYRYYPYCALLGAL
ncbi:hypothetical protein HAZT_HAZT004372 [Hyalella azteca]|uniref:BZIP domain-containing protein n=1 Tax=Hyalella azteca TaxID=294128 RepID=A0A6A0H1J5_HYAAZ|nr:hypothetical protein HAZT_HAZT004372 [Hyalella azteca]